MKPMPDEGGDRAKCLSVNSTNTCHPLCQQTCQCVCIHACAHVPSMALLSLAHPRSRVLHKSWPCSEDLAKHRQSPRHGSLCR